MANVWIKLGMIAASVVIWIFVLARWGQGRAVIAYRPRRPAPWDGGHIFFGVVVYLVLFSVAATVIHYVLPEEAAAPNQSEDVGTAHIIVKMVMAFHRNPWIFLVAAMAAVVVAPDCRRILLSRAVARLAEARQRKNRRWRWSFWRPLPGALPIVLSSLLFAGMHFHVRTPRRRRWRLRRD